MQPTSPSRREFLKQGSGVLIGALVFSSGPIALLAPSKVWALELSALDEPTGRALLKFARHLYPHDTMEDAVYAKFLPEGIPLWQMPFWDSLRERNASVQRCDDCGTFFSDPTVMHVSRGLAGQHPLRFNCRPEVTKIILRKGI